MHASPTRFKEISLKHRPHPLAWHQRVATRGVLLVATTAALLSLAGCGLSSAERPASSENARSTNDKSALWAKVKRGDPLPMVDALGNKLPDSPVTVVTDKGEFQYNIKNGLLDPEAVEMLRNDPNAVLLRRWRRPQ